MNTLIVEGWRTSSHSYALVNQNQLLHLLGDPRLRVYHRYVPFARSQWANVDSGLPASAKARLAAIALPEHGIREDVTYRISFPLRVYPGAGKVFVFGTSELGKSLLLNCVGADGLRESAQPESVDIVTPSAWSRRGFLQRDARPVSGGRCLHFSVPRRGLQSARIGGHGGGRARDRDAGWRD